MWLLYKYSLLFLNISGLVTVLSWVLTGTLTAFQVLVLLGISTICFGLDCIIDAIKEKK